MNELIQKTKWMLCQIMLELTWSRYCKEDFALSKTENLSIVCIDEFLSKALEIVLKNFCWGFCFVFWSDIYSCPNIKYGPNNFITFYTTPRGGNLSKYCGNIKIHSRLTKLYLYWLICKSIHLSFLAPSGAQGATRFLQV